MKTFSIVVPVYQNEKNLPDTVPALLGLARSLPGYAIELVLVDDGSHDRSRELILLFAREHASQITAVLLTRNFGQNAATQAGLRHARGSCVGVISCDLQEPHSAFIEMIRAWENGAKFVLGERVERAEPWLHRKISGTYWYLLRRFAFSDYPQMGFDFCLLDRQVVEDVNRINEKNSSVFTLIFWLGYKAHRVPVKREERTNGESQWSFIKKARFTVDTLIGFTYLPARLITAAGLISSTLCLLYLAVVLAQLTIFHKHGPTGWATLAGLLLLLGAVILFSLGIVAEYLLRILDETRKRPSYVVEKIISS